MSDHNIWPGASYADAIAARAWFAALGFQEGELVRGDGDREVRHSEMIWPEGGRIMVSTRSTQLGPFERPAGSASAYIVVDDPDAVWERAQRLDAPVVRALEDTDYGSRDFAVLDPEGNVWSFGTYSG